MLSVPEAGVMFIAIIVWLLLGGLGIYVIFLFKRFVEAVEKISENMNK